MKDKIEVWSDIEGWPEYRVSNTGKVKRRNDLLKSRNNSWGYPMVTLVKYVNGKRKRKIAYIHRLVAVAFLGVCPEGLEVNHKNGDKTDARLENLEYVTRGQNQAHAYRLGLKTNMPTTLYGEEHGSAKIDNKDVKRIFHLFYAMKMSSSQIAKFFPVSPSQIQRIVNGSRWGHLYNEYIKPYK